jgi:hypothetical protein
MAVVARVATSRAVSRLVIDVFIVMFVCFIV